MQEARKESIEEGTKVGAFNRRKDRQAAACLDADCGPHSDGR
jgi:hypothetical protein